MRRRLTITLKKTILEKLDNVIDGVKIRNRSHAIEYLLNKAFYSDQIQAVILAGGDGSRLRPLTYEMPKVLLPIKNKPLLEYLINQLRASNIKDLIICTNKEGHNIKEKFSDGSRFDVNLTYALDNNLGTGGALVTAHELIKSSPFIVVHGDVYSEIDFKELVGFHQQSGSIVTMVLKAVPETREYGQISLKGNFVTGFFNGEKKGRSNLINSGIYVCSQEVFKYFPAKKVFNFEDVIAKLVQERQVGGYVFDGLWFDVGTTVDYEKLIKALRRV